MSSVSKAAASVRAISVLPHPGSPSTRRGLPIRTARKTAIPIEGIRRGIEIARGERLLVAPCDAPLLRPGLYRLLLEVLGAYDAAVPKFEVLDPVRAVYRRNRVAEILQADRTVPSPSALADRLNYVPVGPDRVRRVDPDLSSFVDVNSRADLDRKSTRLNSSEA